MNQRIPNPECRDGKHGNCDGHGWDIDADTAVRCPCACHKELTVSKIAYPCCPKDRPCEVHAEPVHVVPLVQGGMPDHMHYQELPHKWGMQYTVRTADPSDTYCI